MPTTAVQLRGKAGGLTCGGRRRRGLGEEHGGQQVESGRKAARKSGNKGERGQGPVGRKERPTARRDGALGGGQTAGTTRWEG